MTEYEADVLVVGLGAAGGCAAVEAHDCGARVIVLERQPKQTHVSNTRMSGGGFHSPMPDADFESLKAYAKAMFSGEGLPGRLAGEHDERAEEMAALWARLSPDNERFMRSLDPEFRTVKLGSVAFPQFPGADKCGYAVVKSTYSGTEDEALQFRPTMDADKSQKESGEAFHTCMLTGIEARGIEVHYGTRALELVMDGAEVVGVRSEREGRPVVHYARRGIVLTCGGYEYSKRMREAFLEGPAVEGWAFYGSPANTGDGLRMCMKIGAALHHIGGIAGRIICAVPERRHGLKVGLNTVAVGKPHEIVVDNQGRRYAAERRITKDPSRYIFYKEALQFDTHKLQYPRIPSWMVFGQKLFSAGPLVRINSAAYNGIDWGNDNRAALAKGWILQGQTLAELTGKIRSHPDGRGEMDAAALQASVERWNAACDAGNDAEFDSDPKTMGRVDGPPFYAIPLYPGGPNTKGGLLADPQRRVLDWDERPIPRLYTAGEISSVFQFAYQGGGNLAEGIAFGRLAARNAAAETPRPSRAR
ncbi:MAG TPA: FAD-dependent oxidoreductase [Ramlibacter sp.]|nr:FAD-dependent oxidoreductase [Ramlibacter sp.]